MHLNVIQRMWLLHDSDLGEMVASLQGTGRDAENPIASRDGHDPIS
jgi:hypothetical protein